MAHEEEEGEHPPREDDSSTQAQEGEAKSNGVVMLEASMNNSIRVRLGEHDHIKTRDGKIRCTDFSTVKVPFPWRLWQLLEDSENNGNQSIVSWLLDGDGFSISKPDLFTDSIMRSYFALTTYDSFVQELLRYGFVRTIEENDRRKRVHVFRNPKYNRNAKVKSLAIRRRSVVKSLSARLSAKLNCNTNVFPSAATAPSNQDFQKPIFLPLSTTSSSTTTTSQKAPPGAECSHDYNRSIDHHHHLTSRGASDDIARLEDNYARNPVGPYHYISSSMFLRHDRAPVELSFIDRSHVAGPVSHQSGKSHQLSPALAATKFYQSVDTDLVSWSLPVVNHDLDPVNQMPYPTQQKWHLSFSNNDEQKHSTLKHSETSCVKQGTNDGGKQQDDKIPGRASSQSLEAQTRNCNDSLFPETMHNHNHTLLPDIIQGPPSRFSVMYSQLAKILDEDEPSPQELEKFLEEDILDDSIFD